MQLSDGLPATAAMGDRGEIDHECLDLDKQPEMSVSSSHCSYCCSIDCCSVSAATAAGTAAELQPGHLLLLVQTGMSAVTN